jgi:hypothetical protein
MSADSQLVIQPNGQVHQLVEGEGGVPAGQFLTDILAQTAAIVVNQGPVVPSRSGGQGPEIHRELLGAQMEETFTRRSTLIREVKDCLEVAGEIL